MLGPVVPPPSIRRQSFELQQYAANELDGNYYPLVLEVERMEQEKRRAKRMERKVGMDPLGTLWDSLKESLSKRPVEK